MNMGLNSQVSQLTNVNVLGWQMWLAQLIITFMFATGFLTYYKRLWIDGHEKLKGKPALAWTIRGLVLVGTIVIGTGLHMVGWLVFTNATGLMFHNMGLFCLTLPLMDRDSKLWEYGVRVLGLIDVLVMHHQGYLSQPQFTMSLGLIALAIVLGWLFQGQIRYNMWRRFGFYLYIGVCFWVLLPKHSAGLTVTPMIILQGLSMYLVMVGITTVIECYDHQLDLQNEFNENLAQYDMLTKARSASMYRFEMGQLFDQVTDQSENVAMVVMDIDHFKDINDHYGHNVGDDILTGVAAVIIDQLKQYPGQHRLYRTGGEEFNIVFVGVDMNTVKTIVHSIWAKVGKQQFRSGEFMILVTLSIGVTQRRASDVTADDMYIRADKNLYQTKRNGRNAITIDGETIDIARKFRPIATQALFAQYIMDADTGSGKQMQLHPIYSEIMAGYYDYATDSWHYPRNFTVPFKLQLRYAREVAKYAGPTRILFHLSARQFLRVDAPKLLADFRDANPGVTAIAVELTSRPDLARFGAAATNFHAHQIEIVLKDLSLDVDPKAYREILADIDNVKVSVQAVREVHPDGFKPGYLEQLFATAEDYHVQFIIADIENSVDAEFATKNLNARYVQGYYYDRPKLPRME